LGYTTRPNYDLGIRTVRVPIFQNVTFRRGLEFELTKAVIREIEAKTPYKVVSDECPADTELTGRIVNVTKNVINRNQLNEVREAETLLGVEVVWRDLRSGEILSKPQKGPGAPPPPPPNLPLNAPQSNPGVPPPLPPNLPPEAPQSGPGMPPPPPNLPPDAQPSKPPVVLLQSVGDFIPELGQSRTTAEQQNVNRLAVQIVSMMEKPW
jgi:hypothetical protein